VTLRAFSVTAVLAIGPCAAFAQEAQQAVAPSPAASQPSAEHVRNQVRVFETSLRAALERAAGNFGTRVREALPDYGSYYTNPQLMFLNDPIVTGVVIPDIGFVFHVQIPVLTLADQRIMTELYVRQKPNTPERPVNNARPVTPLPGTPTMPDGFEPDKEYTHLTREALFDAVLDNALALPVPEGQTLTVFAGDLLPPGTNPLVQRSRILVLTIKGEDLLALRRQQVTRDQARERIKESRFGG
jgi:hypothetical protein